MAPGNARVWLIFLMALFTTGIQTLYLPGLAALKYAQLYEYMTEFVACFFFYLYARTHAHTHTHTHTYM